MSDDRDYWRWQDELRQQRQREVGADSAIKYLQALQRSVPGESGSDVLDGERAAQRWPPHSFVKTADELVANVASTPADVALHVVRIDNDGDALVEAKRELAPYLAAFTSLSRQLANRPTADHGQFWVRAELLDDIARVATTLRRAAALAGAVERLKTET